MPKVIVQIIASETMDTAAAANPGRQRAASHTSIGNSKAIGRTVFHGSGGTKMMMMVSAANIMSVTTPSTISLRGGGSRTASARPMTSGATVMMPTISDANQCCQVVQIGAAGLWNNLTATVPPMPEVAVATTAAASSPSTLRSLSRLKGEPRWRSISQAASRASPALQKAKAVALQTFRSPIRLATMVATITPPATGNRASRPSAIRTPEETQHCLPSYRKAVPEETKYEQTKQVQARRADPLYGRFGGVEGDVGIQADQAEDAHVENPSGRWPDNRDYCRFDCAVVVAPLTRARGSQGPSTLRSLPVVSRGNACRTNRALRVASVLHLITASQCELVKIC